MVKLRRIFNKLPPLDEQTICEAHNKIICSIKNLAEIFPQKYDNYDLIDIILAKSYGYHTGLDSLYNDFVRLASFLNNILRNTNLAKILAYKMFRLGKHRLNNGLRNKKDEIPISFKDVDMLMEPIYTDKFYNIFFTDAQSYLRIMILYMSQTPINNNLLVVPRCLASLDILKIVKSENLLFFDDFITESIHNKYANAKSNFSRIYDKNRDEIRKMFNIDSFDFFQFIEAGVENVFKYLLPQALVFYLTVEEIFKKIQVNSVVGARVRKIYDRAFYTCAKNNNIKRFVMLHANIGNDFRYIHTMGHFTNLNGVFVWGERQKKMIEADAFSYNTKIYVTGSPLFQKAKYSKKIAGNDKKMILYAATKDDGKEVAILLSALKNVTIPTELLLKAHPGVSDLPYRRYCKNADVKLVLGSQVLEDYLEYTNLLVSTVSVSSLQAMSIDIPTFYIGIKKHVVNLIRMYFKFDDEEFSWLVAINYNDIKKKIEKILTSKSYLEEHIEIQRNFLKKIVYLDPDPDYPVKKISSIINK